MISKEKKIQAFTADDYMDAASEHMNAARRLHEDSKIFSLAIYVSGLAVECMLRAYKRLRTRELDERHDLNMLYDTSGIIDYLPHRHQNVYASYRGIVATIWSNAHRFRSAAHMRAWLKRKKLDRGIKGDALKENSRILLNASLELVTLGENKWKTRQ